MRICSNCAIEKPDDAFYVGGKYTCKQCVKERATRWYKANSDRAKKRISTYAKANPEKVKAWKEKHFEKNREKILLKSSEYCEKYPERRSESRRKWNDANRQRISEVSAAWQKANRSKCAAAWARYNAAKLKATPAWANTFFIEEIYDLAQRRSKLKTGGHAKWHVDHIVPLISKRVCGLHVEHNLRVIPGSDNMRKGNRIWPDMP